VRLVRLELVGVRLVRLELADGVVEVELLQHLAHVRAEAGNVVAEVRRQVWRIRAQLSRSRSGTC